MTFQYSHNQSSHVMSDMAIRDRVAAQIEADCLPEEWAGNIELVITVMANVYSGDDRNNARIGGVWHSFAEIKRAYQQLNNEDIYNVIAKAAHYNPKNGEAYFRAALYNEAIESRAMTEIALMKGGSL